jgi:hypothetical protein
MSDGLSGAVSATRIMVTAGLAEVAAGSIAMGLGGYLAARSDAEHYASEPVREERETVEVPDVEAADRRAMSWAHEAGGGAPTTRAGYRARHADGQGVAIGRRFLNVLANAA